MLELDLGLRRGVFQLQATAQFGDGASGLFGPSGCGKSTLLALIAGLIRPQRGHLRLHGETLFDAGSGCFVPPHQRRIALVFQDGQLFPHLRVADNLRYGQPRDAVVPPALQWNSVIELLEIGSLLTRFPRQLSGGEQQRVALARALLSAPRLLLLDEPLSSLDERLKQQILPFLRRVRDTVGIPMLYVSHSLTEVRFLADQVYTLDAGRLRLLDAPAGAAAIS